MEADKGLRFALSQLTEHGEPPQQANVMLAQGALALERGRLIDAEALFRQALTLKVQHDHPYGRMRALIGLGDTLAQQGALTEAKQSLDEAHTLAEAIGSRSGAAAPNVGSAWCSSSWGTPRAPRGRLSGGAELRRLGHALRSGRGPCSSWGLPRPRERDTRRRRALSRPRSHHTPRLRGLGGARPAGVHRRSVRLRPRPAGSAGVYEGEMWRQGIAVAALGRDPSLEAEGHAGLAVELILQGRLQEAEAALRQSLELLESLRRPPQTASIQLAFVLAEQSKRPRPRRCW
ncbi:MAG: tetratricopeptide repeat protein [Deltaproteobacteria bacterium]|nr:tetratricopeptide repeat protein [Deltaproteobacteria bacterium]